MSFTEINISFDTEDFTSNRAADAILGTALLLKEEGVRADYNIVGYLAKQLVNWRRTDVLDALKYHEISFHSKTHSMHPTLVEYEDIADHDKAYEMTLREEMEGMGMVRAVTGATRLAAGCSPGSNYSYIAQYIYAENGIGGYTGSSVYLPDGSPLWLCGLMHMQYNVGLESIVEGNMDLDALIERLSHQKRAILFNHPNRINFASFWDGVNYDRENKHPWGEWEEPPRQPAEVTLKYYETLRNFVRLVKAAKNEDGSPKFAFKTIGEIVDSAKHDRVVKRVGMPIYLDALKKTIADGSFNLLTLSDTAAESISLSECLYSATKLITSGEDEVALGDKLLRGFLYAPQGVEAPTTVKREDVIRTAQSIDFDKFLPPYCDCGSVKLGPLDLLIALLTFITNPDLDEVTLEVVPQQPSLDIIPALRDQDLKGKWLFMDSFEDKYMSERLRLQAWGAHR